MFFEIVSMGWLTINHCPTEDMIADFLTKNLTQVQLSKLLSESKLILSTPPHDHISHVLTDQLPA